MFYAYMLRCADGSLYTGYTVDIKKRLAAHNRGAASKYTHAHRPVKLAYLETCPSKSEAMKREAALKRLTKAEKEKLAAEFEAGLAPASTPCASC